LNNYYEILGVTESISNNQLREKIIKIAKQCHPNSPNFNGNNANEFINAFIAFDVLINPTNRLIIRRIKRAKLSGLPESELIEELKILQSAEDDARKKSQSMLKISVDSFKEIYNPNFLNNLLKFINPF
jgi:DnaJ-class molecular chaperone